MFISVFTKIAPLNFRNVIVLMIINIILILINKSKKFHNVNKNFVFIYFITN
jgi:hypothetical protein